MLETVKILGVTITNTTVEKVSEYILLGLKKGGKKLFITTPNPEIIVYANSHLDYKDKLNTAGVSLPDGIGLIWASGVLKKALNSRISGIDFIEKLCVACQKPEFLKDGKPMSMGFLGAKPGVAERTAERLKGKYPWLNIAFAGAEFPLGTKNGEVGHENFSVPQSSPEGSQSLTPGIGARRDANIKDFASSLPSVSPATPPTPAVPPIDILFVAFGAPKQEEWIYENLPKIPVQAAMGVGGSFDYISGAVRRAPKFLRVIGVEWLFRLILQPWRIKRQLALLTFIKLVLQESQKKI